MPDCPANPPQIPQCWGGGGDRIENSPKLNQGQPLWITGGHNILFEFWGKGKGGKDRRGGAYIKTCMFIKTQNHLLALIILVW